MNKSANSTQLVSEGKTSNDMQLAELLVWCSLNGFVAILAVLGNSFVIAAFMRFKNLRTRTNYFVVGLLSIPFWITTMVSIWLQSVSWMKSSLLYRAFIALDVFSCIASILHLLLISLERLYAIGCPVWHRVSSTRSYILAASLSWCLTLIVTVLFAAQKHFTHFPRFLVLLFCFLVPLIMICFTYITLWLLVKFQKHDSNFWNRHKEIKLSLTIFFVILLFIAAWTPFMVINIVMFFCGHCVIPNKVTYVSKLLHYSNSAVNPLMYGYRLPEFKRAFRFLIKSRKKITFYLPKLQPEQF